MKKIPKNFWYAIIVLSILLALVTVFGKGSGFTKAPTEVPFSVVLDEVKQDKVESIQVTGDELTVNLKEEKKRLEAIRKDMYLIQSNRRKDIENQTNVINDIESKIESLKSPTVI